MTSEELEKEEIAKKLRHRAEKYSTLVMIAFGLVGAGAGAIAGGEITRHYDFFEQHYYIGDLCRVGGATAFALFGMYMQDKLDPIKRYLDRKTELSELEFKKLKQK